MTDRNIDELLGAWMDLGPTVAPDRVAEAARLEARTTRQTPAVLGRLAPRRFPDMTTIVRLAAAAAVGVAAVLGFSYLVAPNLGDVPSAPAVTPRQLPDGTSSEGGTLNNQLVTTRVSLELPTGDQLQIVPSDFGWLLAVRDTSDAWGINIADVTGATNHTDRFTQDEIPAEDAATFLDGLDASASYVVSDIATTSLDGRPALSASISLEDGAEDDHLDVEGEGGVSFDTPNVTYVTDVDGSIVLIQVWARTGTDLAVNRLWADSILASMRLTR